MPSESMMVLPSNSTVAGRAGAVPVAIRSCRRHRELAAAAVNHLDGVLVHEVPHARQHRHVVAVSWLRITSTSRPITWLVRASRSETVMSSFTW